LFPFKAPSDRIFVRSAAAFFAEWAGASAAAWRQARLDVPVGIRPPVRNLSSLYHAGLRRATQTKTGVPVSLK